MTAILALEPAKSHGKAGWYAGILRDTGAPEWHKLYTGQSVRVGYRVGRHEYEHTSGKGMMYRLWGAKPTRNMTFVLLGKASNSWQGEDCQVWLNIVEMFLSLALQTLPPAALDHWLPGNINRFEEIGANTAIPLYQSHADKTSVGLSGLFSSSDPEIREYARTTAMKGIQAGNARMKELEYVPRINSERAKSRHNGVLWREADPTQGDLTGLAVKCRRCEKEHRKPFEFIDKMPRFYIDDGKYVIPTRKKCPFCRVGDKFRNTCWVPVDSSVPYANMKTVLSKKATQSAPGRAQG